MEHIKNSQVTVKEYFPPVVEGFQWLQNTLCLLSQSTDYNKTMRNLFISQQKDTCTNVPLINCWTGLEVKFPHISSEAVKKLLLVTSTCLCKTALLTYAATKII
jgi:hypothetical protein